MVINLRPLGDRVVVERIKDETRSKAGIYIPDSAKEKPNKGKILAVGPGKKRKDGTRIPMDVNVGDVILFGKWGGNEVKIDRKEYLLIKEEDIFGIIE